MIAWERAYLGKCGNCGRKLHRGEPILVITIEAIRLRKKRCQECAGEAPPPDLPLVVVREPIKTGTAIPFARFSAGMLPLDWKARASREPGEEG